MAVATINHIKAGPWHGCVKFKYTCDASPSATNLNLGFVPSFVLLWNVTDKDVLTFWSEGMADATASTITTATAAVSSGGITPVAQTDGTNHGILIGTDASVQEASKVFEGFAFH